MSQLKLMIESSLQAKNAGPQHINNIDMYLARSILRLQKKRVIPPREIQFVSLDRKEEKRVGDNKYANFYYLPDDFGSVEDFQVFGKPVYYWKGTEYDVLNRHPSDVRNYFTITSEEGKYILIADPFPDDTDIIRCKYTVSKVDDYDWISRNFWEAIISDIEVMIGLKEPIEAEEHLTDAIHSWREPQNKSTTNRTLARTKPTYFGKRWRY